MQSWIHVIEWRANVRPELTALVDDRGVAYTYAQLRAEVERKAGGWAGLGVGVGVGPGDVVAIVAKNSADFLVHAFALMRAGATPAFVNWRLSARELTEVLTLVEPKAIAADAEFTGLVAAAWPETAARVRIGGGPVPDGWVDGGTLAGPVPPRPALTGETVLALVHTSGTTGRAKAIPLRHGALMMSVADFAIEIGDQVAGSRHLQILPLFHLGGFGQCMQAILTAGTVYIHTAFSPAAVIDAIEADRIEFFTAGPSLIDMLVAEIRRRQINETQHADLSHLREIAYGTAPITPSSLTAALAAFGCRFRQIYGNTESQSMISLLAPEDHHPGHPRLASAGRVSFGWEVRIVDPDGRDLPFAPLAMVEEYVNVIRSVLNRTAGYDGELFRTGMVPLDSPPVRASLPVWLGALGPRMLALAGRIADGVILNLMTPIQAGQAAGVVRDAARAAGRDPAAIEVACVIHLCLSDDPYAAAAAAREVVPRYVLHPAVPRLFGELDGGPDLRGVRELVLAGDRAGAASRVPQQVADGFVAQGSAAQCAERVAEYRAAGVGLPVIFPMPVGGDWGYEQTIAALGDAA